MSNSITCQWLEKSLSYEEDRHVCISLVAYEHDLGIPARFCAGLIPAITLSRQLSLKSIKSTIRIIDPSPIANYCNGWLTNRNRHIEIIDEFLCKNKVDFFFDKAQEMTKETEGVLYSIGKELLSSDDPLINDMVRRIQISGKQHGGLSGESNAILYMAAHPFSWLDLYHPLIWSSEYYSNDYQFVNLMSKPESRFTIVRNYLKDRRPDLLSGINATDYYTTICNTPCYIPLKNEPTFMDLNEHGYSWCLKRYRELRNLSTNHRRILKDFELLVSFLEQCAH